MKKINVPRGAGQLNCSLVHPQNTNQHIVACMLCIELVQHWHTQGAPGGTPRVWGWGDRRITQSPQQGFEFCFLSILQEKSK